MNETATHPRITRPVADYAVTVENAPRLGSVHNRHFSAATMSDLFFNYEHPAYDRVMSGRSEYDAPTDEEIQAALLEDARDFCSTFFEGQPDELRAADESPEAFVKDFLRRL